MTTCDSCWNLKHWKCKGCGCSVCRDAGKSIAVSRFDDETRSLPVHAVQPVKPVRKRAYQPRAIQGNGIVAKWKQHADEILELHEQGKSVEEINKSTGVQRPKIKWVIEHPDLAAA